MCFMFNNMAQHSPVFNTSPALKQHWVNASCLLGILRRRPCAVLTLKALNHETSPLCCFNLLSAELYYQDSKGFFFLNKCRSKLALSATFEYLGHGSNLQPYKYFTLSEWGSTSDVRI